MPSGYEVKAYADLSVIAASMRQLVTTMNEISSYSRRTAEALERFEAAGRPDEEEPEMGLHECPHCHFRFEDAESLRRHLEEGDGCPEA
ncbi:MAG TPA: C2H2-type zinc finger protein [Microlunatus sp.]